MTTPAIDWTATRARIAEAAQTHGADASHLLAATDAQLNDADLSVAWLIDHLPAVSLDWIFGGREPMHVALEGGAA